MLLYILRIGVHKAYTGTCGVHSEGIPAMAKINFTVGRIDGFRCESEKNPAFLWDSAAPGLGIRATLGGAKAFIYQSKLAGQVIRITLGATKTLSIPQARDEARRLQILIDQGKDPRQVKSDALAADRAVRDAKTAADAELVVCRKSESVTVGDVWPIYVTERKPLWSAHHIDDHMKAIQAGGLQRKRSPKLTKPGALATLAEVRLVDLTPARVEAWARVETEARPASARLAWRLLKAFLNWCKAHPDYSRVSAINSAISTRARESLGKPKVRNDVLQREQLAAWFAAVRQIGNPVIAGYLQCLMLTGARREEMAALRWVDVDFQWNSLKLNDKIEDFRMVPMTPFVGTLLAAMPRRNEWVFSSPTAKSGRLAEPRIAHNQAVAIAGLPHLTLHGLRRSFASLTEWIECPAGIAAQIQGHAPQGVREQNYIRRPLDLLRKWHTQIESWILHEAGIEFTPAAPGLKIVTAV